MLFFFRASEILKNAKFIIENYKIMHDFQVYSSIIKGMSGIYPVLCRKIFKHLKKKRDFTLFI